MSAFDAGVAAAPAAGIEILSLTYDRDSEPGDNRLEQRTGLNTGWLTPEAAATYSGFSKGTLANWRTLRNTGANPTAGPDFEKVGARIRYSSTAIDRFILEQGEASRAKVA